MILDLYDKGYSTKRIRDQIFEKHNKLTVPRKIIEFIKRERGSYQGINKGRPVKQYPPEIENIILKYYDKGWSSRRIRDKVLDKTGKKLCFNTIIKFIKSKRESYKIIRVDKNKSLIVGTHRTDYPPEIQTLILKYYDAGMSINKICNGIYKQKKLQLYPEPLKEFIIEARGEYKWERSKSEKSNVIEEQIPYRPPKNTPKRVGTQKFMELEMKRDLNNNYMKNVFVKSMQEEEVDQVNYCIFCGQAHSVDDDLCPDCRDSNPTFDSGIRN